MQPILNLFLFSTITLESLGHDILVDYLFPYLRETEIRALACTSKTLNYYTSDPSVWHDLYFETFGLHPNPFTTTKWPEMFRWRSKASMFTWGSLDNGRLGYSKDDVPEGSLTPRYGVCFPNAVPHLDNLVVADVVCGGFSFAILTAGGEIFVTGELSSKRPTFPIRRNLPVRGRGLLPIHFGGVPHGRLGIRLPDPEPLVTDFNHLTLEDQEIANDKIDYNDAFSHSELIKPKQLDVTSQTNVKFISIACGRCHLIALDEDHDIWIWDSMYMGPGIRAKFSFNDDQPHNLHVRKICGGWNYSAALIDGVGLIVWFNLNLQPLPRTKTERAASKAENKSVPVEYTIVPLTNFGSDSDDYIVDVMAGEGFLVYLTKDGRLYGINTANADSVANELRVKLDLFTKELASLQSGDVHKSQAQFVKLSGSFRNFAALSDSEHVLLGTKSCVISPDTDLEHQHQEQGQRWLPPNATVDLQGPTVIPELQKVGCISVTAGDYHFLGLLRGGKLMSWGRQSQDCGALGLGPADEVVASGQGRFDRSDLIVQKPQFVYTDGANVVAIAAGGWHSCAIMTTEEGITA